MTDLFKSAQASIDLEMEQFEQEEKAAYAAAMETGFAAIAAVEDPESAKTAQDAIEGIAHALTSQAELRAAFRRRLKEAGLKWDKEAGAYVVLADTKSAGSWRYWMEAGDASGGPGQRGVLLFTSPGKAAQNGRHAAGASGLRMRSTVWWPGRLQNCRMSTRKKAVRRFSRLCMGGQPQVPISGNLFVSGLDLTLYGVCDYVKAGIIYDIKRVSRYEYGKYQTSSTASPVFTSASQSYTV